VIPRGLPRGAFIDVTSYLEKYIKLLFFEDDTEIKTSLYFESYTDGKRNPFDIEELLNLVVRNCQHVKCSDYDWQCLQEGLSPKVKNMVIKHRKEHHKGTG